MTSHAAAIDRQTMADALLRCGPWYAGHDDAALQDHARAQARAVTTDAAALGADLRYAHQRAERRAERHGIEPPQGVSIRAAVARLSCEIWWRRKLRRLSARRVEQRERVLGRVHDRAGIYVSHRGLAARRDQTRRNTRTLEAVTATNQEGQEYTLAELAELGLANPDHRRAELMLRIGDTEKEASRLGHVGMFYTLTCPSRFHAVHSKTARINRKYEGATPREAQAHLQSLWARARAKLNRDHLGIYGIRVVEPHHDGTPHWHLLLWCDPADEPAITDTLRRYALEDSPEEVAGREAVRFKPVKIDASKGSAAGYVAKYVAKNINGKQHSRQAVDGDHLDHYGHDLTESAPRIEAWAATWGIRQFQFIGLPSVTVWREVRRLKHDADLTAWEDATDPDPEAAAILGDIRRAALAGRWDRFVSLMGGAMAPRDAAPVRPWAVIRQDIDADTGEDAPCRLDQRGRYGEPVAGTWGLTVTSSTGSADYLTRLYRWEIATKPSPADFDLEGLTVDGSAVAWTGVINCTQEVEPRRDRDPREIFAPWELAITESVRRMHPPADPARVAEVRKAAADEADDYRYMIESMAIARQKRRDTDAANQRRIEQGRRIVAGWLLDRTLDPSDLTTEQLEMLTA